MSFASVRQTLCRDFTSCFDQGKVPPLRGYLADYVKSGCTVVAEDFRLLPLTATSLRFLNATPNFLTDCLLELQSKFAEFVPDDWGGHLEKGHREIGVIGFNVLEADVLDIREIAPTTTFLGWAEPKLKSLEWEQLLLRAVIDFGRYCKAKQIRLRADSCSPVGSEQTADGEPPVESANDRKQISNDRARALGFEYDRELDCFVLNLGSDLQGNGR